MTTKAKDAVAEESKELVVGATNTGVSTEVDMGFMDMGDFGSGFEGADKDSFAIPFLQLLQKMSPKVDEDHAEYIQGAKAGMFYNTVTGKLFDGKSGLDIIPCAYKRSFILWGGREGDGGYKGEFTVEEFMTLSEDENKVKVLEGKAYVPNEDGSIVEKKNDYYSDTRSHFVIVLDRETGEYGRAILSLASSQIKSSKKLMTALQQKKVKTPQGMRTPPTFANIVKVTSSGRSNDSGSWSGVDFELTGTVQTADLYKEAKEFFTQVVGGEVKADYAKADAASAQGDQSGGDGSKPQDAEGF